MVAALGPLLPETPPAARMRCGNAYPPADGTREREIIDRFKDFLSEAGPCVSREDVQAGRTILRTPAARYRIRFLAWRTGSVPR